MYQKVIFIALAVMCFSGCEKAEHKKSASSGFETQDLEEVHSSGNSRDAESAVKDKGITAEVSKGIEDIDPFGIEEFHEMNEANPKLIACAEDINCEEHGEALFWYGVSYIQDAPWENQKPNANENPEDDEEIVILTEFQIDTNSEAFLKGMELLKASYQMGSPSAANELGLLYLEQDALRDLDTSEEYFRVAIQGGDYMAALNLARVYYLKNPENTKLMLSHLKVAADNRDEIEYFLIYQIALREFGDLSERQNALLELDRYKEEAQNAEREFKSLFYHALE